MIIHVTETLDAPLYHFTDPNAFLSCDNLNCSSAWVTESGLVVWVTEEGTASSSRFTNRLLVTCCADCLHSALHDRGRDRRRSEPRPVVDWLDIRSACTLGVRGAKGRLCLSACLVSFVQEVLTNHIVASGHSSEPRFIAEHG
jgi:hypothetical protein